MTWNLRHSLRSIHRNTPQKYPHGRPSHCRTEIKQYLHMAATFIFLKNRNIYSTTPKYIIRHSLHDLYSLLHCSDHCHNLKPLNLAHCDTYYTITPILTVIFFTPLHTFVVIVFTPFTHTQPIVLVHLVMACPGRHRQPYYWYILSWHFQFTRVRTIVYFHVVL